MALSHPDRTQAVPKKSDLSTVDHAPSMMSSEESFEAFPSSHVAQVEAVTLPHTSDDSQRDESIEEHMAIEPTPTPPQNKDTIQAKSMVELQELSVSPSPKTPQIKRKALRRGPRVTLTSQKSSQQGIKAPRGLVALPANPYHIHPSTYPSTPHAISSSMPNHVAYETTSDSTAAQASDQVTNSTHPRSTTRKTARPQPHVFEDESVKESIDDLVENLEATQKASDSFPSLVPQVTLQEDLQTQGYNLNPQFAPYHSVQAPEDEKQIHTEEFIQSLVSDRTQNVSEVLQQQQEQAPVEIQVHTTAPLVASQGDVRLLKDMRLADSCTIKYMINKIHGVESWLAEHDQYGLVVLKLVWPQMLSENTMMWQFDAEMQLLTLQNIQDQVVQTVYDWGEEKITGAWYVVLAWVEGESLADRLKKGPLPYSLAYHYFLGLTQGVFACHQHGVTHRKIQPSHIILSPQAASLISFQWVEEVAGEDLQRKQQGVYQKLGARPKFLAPEWTQDTRITSAADVYALAACLLTAVNHQAQSWKEAPIKLQAALAGALYHDPSLRSTAQDFHDDLVQSEWYYEYQNSKTTTAHTQVLALHEVVQEIRKNELGWHLVRRVDHDQEEACQPWGNCPELVKAVQRAQRYQSHAPIVERANSVDLSSLESKEKAISQQLKDLQIQKEKLQARMRSIEKQEQEWSWKDEALRVRENELLQKDAGLQEEHRRLATWRDQLQSQSEQIEHRQKQMDEQEKLVDQQLAEANKVKAESLQLMAETRVLQNKISQQEEQQKQALALTESELAAQRALRVHMQTVDYQNQVEEAAAELLAQRDLQALQEREKEKEKARAELLAQREAEAQLEAQNHAYRVEQAEQARKRMVANLQEGLPFRTSMKEKPEYIVVPKPTEAEISEIWVGKFCWRLRYCPAGMTWLGSEQGEGNKEERPRHKVRINKGFWLAETPVTQALWNQIMQENPSQFKGLDRPVEGVTWLEAVLFCNALSEAQGLSLAYQVIKDKHRTEVIWHKEAQGYRLPTEAEWEYAARCGQSGQGYQYANGHDLDTVAWFSKNARGETHAVGLKEANAWGLHDLCGNVWEWCHDTWQKDIYRTRSDGVTRDPVFYQPLLTPKSIRGGSWYDFAASCRIAYRPGLDVNGPYGVGFRPCLPS